MGSRVLFRWKQETAPAAAPLFASVEITYANAPSDKQQIGSMRIRFRE